MGTYLDHTLSEQNGKMVKKMPSKTTGDQKNITFK